MIKGKNTIKVVAALSMLAALSIILGKYMQIPIGDTIRFSFENLPILFAGIFFGPISGALVGVCADLIGCLLVGYAINPILTVAAVLIGVTAGVMPKICGSLPKSTKIAITVITAHLLGSVILKSFGLSLFYSLPFGVTLLSRLVNYLIVGITEGLLLYILAKDRSVVTGVSKILGKKVDI